MKCKKCGKEFEAISQIEAQVKLCTECLAKRVTIIKKIFATFFIILGVMLSFIFISDWVMKKGAKEKVKQETEVKVKEEQDKIVLEKELREKIELKIMTIAKPLFEDAIKKTLKNPKSYKYVELNYYDDVTEFGKITTRGSFIKNPYTDEIALEIGFSASPNSSSMPIMYTAYCVYYINEERIDDLYIEED